MNSPVLHSLLQSFGLLLPASIILYYALNAGLLPDWDYWSSLPGSLSETGMKADIERWFDPLNEHYVLIPKIIYSLNRYFSGGWNVGLSVTAWAMALPQAYFLLYLLRSGWQPNIWLLTILTVAIGVFIFTPRAYHNWILGMSGVAWVSANLFALASITCLYRFHQKPSHLSWWMLSILTALLGMLSYTTALAVFPALLMGICLLALKKRYIFSYLLLSILVFSVYSLLYKRPMQNPDLQRSFLTLAEYILIFLGSPFSMDRLVAMWIGASGILISLLMFVLTIIQKRGFIYANVPWLMIQAYAFGNALMAAVARSNMGIDQAFSSRYATLPALFWLALLVVISRYVQAKGRWWLYCGLPMIASLVMFSSVQIFRVGHPMAKSLMQRAKLKSVAGVSLYTGIYDTKLLFRTLAPWFGDRPVVEKVVPILKKIKHTPFHGTFDDCPQLGSILSSVMSKNSESNSMSAFIGSFDKIEPVNPIGLHTFGWFYMSGKKPVCIVITNQSHTVRGIAVYGFERKDIAKKKKHLGTDKVGWLGYAKAETGDTHLSAYVLYKTKGNWYHVPPDQSLASPLSVTHP